MQKKILVQVFNSGDLVKIILISDTHGLHNKLEIPDGELLIHAGDFTRINTSQEIKTIDDWFGSLPMIIVIITSTEKLLFRKFPYLKITRTFREKNSMKLF